MYCAAFREISNNLINISQQHMLNSMEKIGPLQMDTENNMDIALTKIPSLSLFGIFSKRITPCYVIVCLKFCGNVFLKQKYSKIILLNWFHLLVLMFYIFFIWNVRFLLSWATAQYQLREITFCYDLHGLLYFTFSQILLNVSGDACWNHNWV